ncbi:MAG: MutS-related protein [Bryobacteraceae bacterium]
MLTQAPVIEQPRDIYMTLLQERRASILAGEGLERRLGFWRLATVAVAGALVWVALSSAHITILWTLIPAALFVALMAVHARRTRKLEKQRRAARFFERGLSRLDGTWHGTGSTGEAYLDMAHPYAQDLDLFGIGSLFELLSTARTRAGEQTLARWLLEPADPPLVTSRQAAVEELRPRLDLREDLAVLAEDARTGVDADSLAAWGEAPPRLGGRGLRLALWACTLLGISGAAAGVTLLLNLTGSVVLASGTGLLLRDLFLATLAINGWFYYRHQKRTNEVVAAVDRAAHELGLISEVLALLEREQFQAPLLVSLRRSLTAQGAPPSRRLAQLKRLVEYLDSRDNVFVRVAEIFVLWTPHVAARVEQWRRRSGPAVRRWLSAVGEIEALASLASHAFEHPQDPFPEFILESPLLEAEEIGHPLIPESKLVRNSVSLGGSLRLLVVSGSNMSGKSTLLRTLGVNAVLAQAGAPVRAARLRLSPLAVGASIRVNDSLQGGISRFYAEILRLRQILDQTAGPRPVLFLIDEFLHGTNSHDRRIGAEALVRGLVERGAMGLITTHDLALAGIADALDGRASNVHFEDRIEDGKIHFDYRMQPGVVRKSNAIELMRSVGLEI